MTTVLVIDDEPMIRWCVEQTLRAAGYEVALAETAAAGLALFGDRRPEVVLLDVRLPDASGISVLDHINEAEASAAVIVMTAFEEGCTRAEAVRHGARGYLKKPFDFERLGELVGQVLAGSPDGSVGSGGPESPLPKGAG